MRGLPILVALVLMAPLGLAAQQLGPDPSRDSLRRMIAERFSAKVQSDLGLTDDQATKLRGTVRTYFTRRRALEAQERDLRAALAAQLRPGVAANQDSVSHLMNEISKVREEYVASYDDENREMSGYLTPVQRAQYFMLRERLLERIKRAKEERRDRPRP